MEMVELDVVREMRRASGVPSYRPGCMVSKVWCLLIPHRTCDGFLILIRSGHQHLGRCVKSWAGPSLIALSLCEK